MKISVTSEHIAKGRENFKLNNYARACNCPIALALRDARFKEVVISPTGRFHYQTDQMRTAQLPNVCANFISYFDNCFSSEDVAFWPFEFEIEASPE